MEGRNIVNTCTPSPAPRRDHDRRRRAGFRGTVTVHGTVPGSGTMRQVGEVFAMRPATRDGTNCEE